MEENKISVSTNDGDFEFQSIQEITFIAGGEEWTPDANAVIPFYMVVSCIKEFPHFVGDFFCPDGCAVV